LRTALEGLVNDRGETIDQMYHAGERNR